ncbi:unnamed protein product, partial [marine sediment metagenome]
MDLFPDIRDFTPRRSECLVLMPFGEEIDAIYIGAIAPGVEDAGLSPVRADDLRQDPFIPRDIWRAIHEAEMIIADVTGNNPNVLWELGVAHGRHRPVIMLTQSIGDLPFDLMSVRAVPYSRDRHGLERLRMELPEEIRAALRESRGLLWDMLSPLDALALEPCYIVARPLPWTGRGDPDAQDYHTYSHRTGRTKTRGSYIGIRGLIRAFGEMYRERLIPEVIDSEVIDPKLMQEPHNLYLIGSGKINQWTEH